MKIIGFNTHSFHVDVETIIDKVKQSQPFLPTPMPDEPVHINFAVSGNGMVDAVFTVEAQQLVCKIAVISQEEFMQIVRASATDTGFKLKFVQKTQL